MLVSKGFPLSSGAVDTKSTVIQTTVKYFKLPRVEHYRLIGINPHFDIYIYHHRTSCAQVHELP